MIETAATSPRCPYFGVCGGCTSQHVPYELQLENKRKLVANRAKAADAGIEVKVFSGSPFGYRNRMDFIFHDSGLGFREKGKWWKIVDVVNCPISEDRVNKLLFEVREYFKGADAFELKKHTGTYRYAVIRTADDSCISFVLNPSSPKLSEAVEKIKKYAESSKADNILITYVSPDTDQSTSADYFVVKGNDFLTENYLGKSFSYSAQGFFQNNHSMAEKMHAYVHNLLRTHQTPDACLLDLYGGVGSFGIVNASIFSRVVSVESFEGCTISANKNIAANALTNMKALCLDAAQLKKLELPEKLIVITDPPRSGMHEKTIEQLKRLKPRAIIYVSCNPDQLGKDLTKFKQYTVKSVALFDLFPQTPHMEAVVELVPK